MPWLSFFQIIDKIPIPPMQFAFRRMSADEI
jgi:hypothetical protein